MKRIRNLQFAIRNRDAFSVTEVALDRLVPHPESPNHLSKANFAKLVRNIEQTGLYEPLIVRPAPGREGFYQIIHGHHRCQALCQLGHETADAVVWDIDDRETDILLATLNRLVGRDKLDKKLTLLRRLGGRLSARDLAKRLPYTSTQLERLTATTPFRRPAKANATAYAIPLVFFVNAEQQAIVEAAMQEAEAAGEQTANEKADMVHPPSTNRSARRAQALTFLAQRFVNTGSATKVDDTTPAFGEHSMHRVESSKQPAGYARSGVREAGRASLSPDGCRNQGRARRDYFSQRLDRGAKGRRPAHDHA